MTGEAIGQDAIGCWSDSADTSAARTLAVPGAGRRTLRVQARERSTRPAADKTITTP